MSVSVSAPLNAALQHVVLMFIHTGCGDVRCRADCCAVRRLNAMHRVRCEAVNESSVYCLADVATSRIRNLSKPKFHGSSFLVTS